LAVKLLRVIRDLRHRPAGGNRQPAKDCCGADPLLLAGWRLGLRLLPG